MQWGNFLKQIRIFDVYHEDNENEGEWLITSLIKKQGLIVLTDFYTG